MQLSTILLAVSAGLAAAVPTGSELTKRGAPGTWSCPLTNYQDATAGPIKDAVNFLKEGQPTVWGQVGGCRQAICAGKTAIEVCVDSAAETRATQYDPLAVAGDIEKAYEACYGSMSGGKGSVHAFQYWEDGWNVLVTGGHDC